ncbi:MAG: hypothetical protein JWQ97_3030 [Phenylobacterium sp.]|nr:hypothetical protein [Phenylobacterium sp.]
MLAAGLWLTASACAAAQPDPAMRLGPNALPPVGYVAFCERQPWDCGDAAPMVLAAAARADAERAELLALGRPAAAGNLALAAPAALLPALASPPAMELSPVSALLEARVVRATVTTRVAFVDPTSVAETEAAEPPAPEGPPRMTPQLWSKLNRVNDQVNRSIQEATDLATYGQVDRWATPLENGVRTGDCEDFVLEKRRALLTAGLPREALNIALVTTSWGESHAVLLVDTSEGELVLDNLSGWIVPWKKAAYRWRERQMGGEPFNWVMIQDPARPSRSPELRPSGGEMTVADLR